MEAAVLRKALGKIVAALEGSGRKPVAIGAIAHQAWGVKTEPQGVELLIPAGPEHRDQILGAARGEGFKQEHDLHFSYTDPKTGGTTTVDIVEASTPMLQKMHGRAQLAGVLEMSMALAGCEDLILARVASGNPADRAVVVELLKCTAGRMDAQYLKREAEAAGLFEKVKSAWQEAKK
jgi:hypothetical protein